jgi:hypothetical protein
MSWFAGLTSIRSTPKLVPPSSSKILTMTGTVALSSGTLNFCLKTQGSGMLLAMK